MTVIEFLGIVVAALVLLAILAIIFHHSQAVVFVRNEEFGVLERKFSFTPTNREPGLITRNRSPGYLPKTISGGWHFFFPFQYRVHKHPLITVSDIGYLFARNGEPLQEGQVLAAWPEGITPDNTAGFLDNGGQRGLQRQILRGGTYAINLALFSVITKEKVHRIASANDTREVDSVYNLLRERDGFSPVSIEEDAIGVITVQDGPSLEDSQIIAPNVGTDANIPETFHNCFQDINAFLRAGGRRGRQNQTLTEGTYYINRLFATVEKKPKTIIPTGSVGIVTSYLGEDGADQTNENYRHGQLVERGQRGIWKEPLRPGKYAYNPYAYQIQIIPTTNFQLQWVRNTTESHKFDANLSEITLITSDAFEPLVKIL